jgi:hypothetical protein
MARRLDSLRIPASAIHTDDGVADHNPEPIFDWRAIYGRLPAEVADHRNPAG